MIKNYLVSYLKRTLKYKTQFLITLLSIVVGFTVFLGGYYYINFESEYDQFHKESNQIYRILSDDSESKSIYNSLPLGSTAAKEIPEVLSFVRLYEIGGNIVTYNDIKIQAYGGYIADTTFFDMFTFPLINGNYDRIRDPNNVFLSRDFAQKIFGEKDPVGEIVTIEYIGKYLLTVAGVYDVPANSNIQFEFVIPNHDFIKNPIFSWKSQYNFITYLKLKKRANIKEVENKIFLIDEKNTERHVKVQFHLQPLKDIYLSTLDDYKAPGLTKYGNKKLFNLLCLLLILILLILWTNLLNVIFVTINNRVKEFSLRKACGAFYHQLVQQTVFETFLTVVISGICAIPIIKLLTDIAFSKLELLISIDVFSIQFWIIFALVIIINVLVLGFFNFIALKGVNTDRVSKYQKHSVFTDLLKRSLIVLQLVVTIFIISFILIIDKQINFMMTKDLGIEIDDIVLVRDPTAGSFDEVIVNQGKTFMSELVNYSEIIDISSTTNPGRRFYGSGTVKFNSKVIDLTFGQSDPNFLNTYDVKLLAGRNLSNIIRPWTSVLINNKLAKKLGFNKPEEALNNIIVTEFGNRGNLEIVGVVEDYHHLSFENSIEPVCFLLWPYSPHQYYSVRVKDTDSKTIALIEDKFSEVFGEDCFFDYVYLRDFFDNQYSEIIKFRNVINLLMIIIVFLCCIGVYGFFSAELSKKIKSIAIRRCLGAQKSNILYFLIENYYLSLLIAAIITIPVTYFIVKEWLNTFSYTADLSWWSFIKPVLLILIIMLVTILNKLLSALRLNTVEALRND